MTGISGYQSFSGIKAVTLSALDTECVQLAVAQAEAQAEFDTQLAAVKAERKSTYDASDNLTTTYIVGFIMLFVLIGLALICIKFHDKNQKFRQTLEAISEEVNRKGKQLQYVDGEYD